jgi:hypothetical protein
MLAVEWVEAISHTMHLATTLMQLGPNGLHTGNHKTQIPTAHQTLCTPTPHTCHMLATLVPLRHGTVVCWPEAQAKLAHEVYMLTACADATSCPQ